MGDTGEVVSVENTLHGNPRWIKSGEVEPRSDSGAKASVSGPTTKEAAPRVDNTRRHDMLLVSGGRKREPK